MTALLTQQLTSEVWRYLVAGALLVAAGGFLVWSFMAPRNRTLRRALDERSAQVVELRVKSKGVDHGD